MPAYLRRTVDEFISEEPIAVIGILQQAYASDGFVSQYTRQTQAWDQMVPELQRVFAQLLRSRPEAKDWTILLEYPLYRLRRRIDAVILADGLILVVECKVGADVFTAADRRQVEEYALDLRDFHAQSFQRQVVPLALEHGRRVFYSRCKLGVKVDRRERTRRYRCWCRGPRTIFGSPSALDYGGGPQW